MATSSLGRLTLDLAVKLSEFTDGMSKAERETKRKTDAMNKSVNTFRDNFTDALGGSQIGSAIDELSYKLKNLNGGLGAASAAMAGMAVGGAVVAAGALSKMAVEAAAADKELAVLAKRANVGVENFQVLSRASSELGVSQDQLGSILADVQEKLGEFSATEGGGAKDFFEALQNNTSLTTDEIRELGKTLQGKDGVEAIQLLKNKLDELGATSQEQRFVFESFASDLGNLMPLFDEGGVKLAEYEQALDSAGVIKTKEAIEQSIILTNQITSLKTQFEGFRSQLVTDTIPALSVLISYFTAGATEGDKFRGSIGKIGEVTRGVSSGIVGISAAISILTDAMQQFGLQMSNIGQTAQNFFEADGLMAKGKALADGWTNSLALGVKGFYDIGTEYKNARQHINAILDGVTMPGATHDAIFGGDILEGIRQTNQGLQTNTEQAKENAKAQKELAKAAKGTTKEISRMEQVYKAFIKAGLSDNQARIITAEVGRESSFLDKNLFGYHKDPHNGAINAGMISWQGSRGKQLIRYLTDLGLVKNGKIMTTQEALDAQAMFVVKEITSNSRYSQTKNDFLANPNVSYQQGNRALGKNYIRWRYDDPRYQSGHRNRDKYYEQLNAKLGNKGLVQDMVREQQQAQKEAERLAKERTRIIVSQMDEEERLRYEHEQRKAKITELFGADSKQALKEERRYEEELHELRMKDAKEFLRIQKQVASIRQTIKDGTYRAATMLNDVVARSTMSNDDYARYSLGAQEDAARQGANNTYSERVSAIESVESMADRAALLQEAKAEHEAAMYAIDLEYAEKRKQLEREVTDSKIAMYQGATTSMLGMLQGFFGESKTLQRMAWAAEKGFTLARILIKEKEALMNAWSSAPFPYNLGAVTTTAMKTGALTAAADAITPKGFKTGGYTGSIGANNVAGVVHGNEYVFDADTTKTIGVERLEQIRQGKGLGGDVNIYNYAPGVDASAVVNDDGSVDVKIEKAVKQSWNNLANPNSHESKMLGRNVQAPRKRA